MKYRNQARFDQYVYYSIDGCHYWTAGLSKDGYGKFSVDGKTVVASRYAYEMYVGAIPDGLLICHRCDHPSCVNPHHLFTGTHKENKKDMTAKRKRVKAYV